MQVTRSESITNIVKALIAFKQHEKFQYPDKLKKVEAGKTNYKYADLPEITECTEKALLACGLYVTYSTIEKEGEFSTVKQLIAVKEGSYGNQVESYKEFLFCVATMKITVLHAESGEWLASYRPVTWKLGAERDYGSAMTYAMRYLFSALLNVIADVDDDGGVSDGVEQTITTAKKPNNMKNFPSPTQKPEPAPVAISDDEAASIIATAIKSCEGLDLVALQDIKKTTFEYMKGKGVSKDKIAAEFGTWFTKRCDELALQNANA